MKPELLLAELHTAGVHNGDLGKTVSRLDKSKAWKRQRIVVLIPADQKIHTKVYLSHMNLAFPPNNGVARIAAIGMEVGEAYSTAIEGVLAHPVLKDWEFALCIEHDNMPPPDGVLRLLERMEEHPEFAGIGGLYFLKGQGGLPSGHAQIWGDVNDSVINFRPQLPDPDGGLVECCGLGMGFTMFRMSMFKDKKLRRPWFVTQKKDGIATQDLHFAMDAKKHGYRFAVDCGCKVGHYSSEEDCVY